MQPLENSALKRKAEAGEGTKREQRMRRPAALEDIGDELSDDASG